MCIKTEETKQFKQEQSWEIVEGKQNLKWWNFFFLKITKWRKPLVFMQEKGWFFDQSKIFNA